MQNVQNQSKRKVTEIMKKVLSLILSLVMCLFLGSCSSVTETEEEVVVVKKYEVNETATSSLFECTVSNVSFTQKVSIDESAGEYMLPATSASTVYIPADYGQTLLCFSVKLKYIGNKSIQNAGFGNGEGAIGFYAIYDSDYQFDTFYASQYESFWWRNYEKYDGHTSWCYDFEPLSNETYSIRAFIELPDTVLDSEKTLDLVVNLLNNESVTFSIMP